MKLESVEIENYRAIDCLRLSFDPHIDLEPPRLVLRVKLEEGGVETLEIDQLSGGQRAVLALAADLAARMTQANPHLDAPLNSEAIVLIDEVELHLHPSWQQRILKDLRRTFPNTQFIVSTHSPQVLTTVEPEHIVELARENGRIVAGSAAGWTYGAESGDVLSVVMGVNERPVNDFTEKLDLYKRLINDDKGESGEALELIGRSGSRGAADGGRVLPRILPEMRPSWPRARVGQAARYVAGGPTAAVEWTRLRGERR